MALRGLTVTYPPDSPAGGLADSWADLWAGYALAASLEGRREAAAALSIAADHSAALAEAIASLEAADREAGESRP